MKKNKVNVNARKLLIKAREMFAIHSVTSIGEKNNSQLCNAIDKLGNTLTQEQKSKAHEIYFLTKNKYAGVLDECYYPPQAFLTYNEAFEVLIIWIRKEFGKKNSNFQKRKKNPSMKRVWHP